MPMSFNEKIERAICEMADWRHERGTLVYADAAVPDDIDDTAPRQLSYQTTAAEALPRMPAAPAPA